MFCTSDIFGYIYIIYIIYYIYGAFRDVLKGIGSSPTWKALLEMEQFVPFRKSERSIEDILYPKNSYSSSKPLPVLDRQLEAALVEEAQIKLNLSAENSSSERGQQGMDSSKNENVYNSNNQEL